MKCTKLGTFRGEKDAKGALAKTETNSEMKCESKDCREKN